MSRRLLVDAAPVFTLQHSVVGAQISGKKGMAPYEYSVNIAMESVSRRRQPGARTSQKKFVAEGYRFLRQSVASGAVVDCVIYSPAVLQNAAKIEWIEGLAKNFGIPRHRIDPAQYYRLSSADEPDGILSIQHQRWSQLPKAAKDSAIYIAIEEIGSPGNFGSIIRTCAAGGVRGIILLDARSDPYDPVCVRATMGALHKISLIRSTLATIDSWADECGFEIVGTSPSAAMDFHQIEYSRRTVIMVGGEKTGLSPHAVAVCDKSVKIPMHSGVDSLNVAVATGIILFEANRSKTSARA